MKQKLRKRSKIIRYSSRLSRTATISKKKDKGTDTPAGHYLATGPAGLFCGYMLAAHGYQPILLERGADVDQRTKDVKAFWENGRLNLSSNVQFGEGGAGTISDQKRTLW